MLPRFLSRSFVRPDVDAFRVALLASLGIATACGGSTNDGSNSVGGSAMGTAGTTSAGGANAGGASGAGGSVAASLCVDPTPIGATGFVQCADGSVDRASAVAAVAPAASPTCVHPAGTPGTDECSTDGDCAATTNGRCLLVSSNGGALIESCKCVDYCTSDDDCGASSACVPQRGFSADSVGPSQCIPATCATNEACPSGECGLGLLNAGCAVTQALACRDPADACRIDGGCATGFSSHCGPTGSGGAGAWSCQQAALCPGRPLVSEGPPRVAPTVHRDDWIEDSSVGVSSIGDEARAALAAHWSAVAAFEHASVGSFARFSLELLAAGAPPSLVVEAHHAAMDEIEHARLAYGFASTYAGAEIGPGPLDIAGVVPASDRRSIVAALVREGCVAETLAAAELREAANAATDAHVAPALARIADDEARHATFAWRCLAWLIADDESLRAHAASTLAASVREHVAATLPTHATLPEHGLLALDVRTAVRRETLVHVVLAAGRGLGLVPG